MPSRFIQILETIQDFNTGAGILSNLLLLYIIRRYSSADLGTYKYLLTAFSLHDIFLTLLHMLLRPKNILIGTVFSLISDGPVESRHLTCIYSACFSVPFSLMCYHFIYRYWAIESPFKLDRFTNVRFVSGLVLYILIEAFLWYLFILYGTTGYEEDDALREVRQVFVETYGKSIEHGWLILDNWRNGEFNLRPAVIVLVLDTLISAKIVLSLTLAYKTLAAIRENSAISTYKRKYHVQVLMTLCAQASYMFSLLSILVYRLKSPRITVLPLLFVFLPYFCSITFPLVRVSVSFISPLCIPLISFFPSWDAPIVFFFIRDYREGMRDIMRRVTALFTSKTTVKDIRPGSEIFSESIASRNQVTVF